MAKKTLSVSPENLSVKQSYITWLLTPKHKRPDDESTQEEFSKKHSITTKTLCKWKERQEFWDEVKREYDKDREIRLINVRKSLVNIATDGDNKSQVAAIKLFLQYEEKWTEKFNLDGEMSFDGKAIETLGEAFALAIQNRKKK